MCLQGKDIYSAFWEIVHVPNPHGYLNEAVRPVYGFDVFMPVYVPTFLCH